MSTRTRIILQYDGKPYTYGALAIKYIASLAAFAGKFPKGKAKKETLLEMAEKLPKEYTLILIQEPRHCSKQKSLYWQYRGLK